MLNITRGVSLLVMVAATEGVGAGDLRAPLTGFGANSNTEWVVETAFGLPNQQEESHYYLSVLLRKNNVFFGWPGQRVYEVGSIFKAVCDATCANQTGSMDYRVETPIAGLSQELRVVSNRYFSVKASLGGYIKAPTDTVGSVFTFGEKVSVASNTDGFELEIFWRHFSNGSFTTDNRGYDFAGLSFSSRF